MKKLNLWLFASLFVAAFALSACSSSDDSTSGSGGSTPPPPAPDPATMKFAALSGVVCQDSYGYGDMTPLTGVKVSSGTETMTTGVNGLFQFGKVNVVDNRVVVKFEKAGYMDVVRSFPAGEQLQQKVVMQKVQTETFSASETKILGVTTPEYGGSTMTVQFEANSFKKADGSTYTGQVTAESTYLNPDNSTAFAEAMPGDLTTNGGEQLISGGMVAVNLKDADGNELTLDASKPATLMFPIPQKIKSNTPDSEPRLWYFDEAKGVWVDEGAVEMVGDYYQGKVTHFSWHNLDYPEARATLKVKVVDPNGTPIPFIPVDIDGERQAMTNAQGVATSVVPSNTKLYIRVEGKYYGYASDKKIQNITLAGGETKTVELKMEQRAAIINGHVINSGSGSKVCTVFISYQGMNTPSTVSDLDGAFQLYAPCGYTGSAKLIGQFGDGSQAEVAITLNGEDQTVNLTVDNGSSAGGGIIHISGNGLNFNYVLPLAADGGTLRGTYNLYPERNNTFYADFGEQPNWDDPNIDPHSKAWTQVSIEIPDYSESKTSFTNSTLRYYLEGHAGRRSLAVEKCTINLTRNGETFTFKISKAAGVIQQDMDRNIDWDNPANVTVDAEIGARLTYSGE